MRIGDDTEVHTLTEYLVELRTVGLCDACIPDTYVDITGERACRFGRRLLVSNDLGDWTDTYPTPDAAQAALDDLHCGHGVPAERPCYVCDEDRWTEYRLERRLEADFDRWERWADRA